MELKLNGNGKKWLQGIGITFVVGIIFSAGVFAQTVKVHSKEIDTMKIKTETIQQCYYNLDKKVDLNHLELKNLIEKLIAIEQLKNPRIVQRVDSLDGKDSLR
jgi:hypothetical protein